MSPVPWPSRRTVPAALRKPSAESSHRSSSCSITIALGTTIIIPRTMSDPETQNLTLMKAQMFCAYCGCPVKTQFYFCTNCAAPWQAPEAVLPAMRPIQQTEGELIVSNAPQVLPLFWTYFVVVIAAAVIGSAVFSKERPDLRLFFE